MGDAADTFLVPRNRACTYDLNIAAKRKMKPAEFRFQVTYDRVESGLLFSLSLSLFRV